MKFAAPNPEKGSAHVYTLAALFLTLLAFGLCSAFPVAGFILMACTLLFFILKPSGRRL